MTDVTAAAAQPLTSVPDPIGTRKDRCKDSLLRIKTVTARTGLPAGTIYRREGEGTFPRREKLGGRSVAWYESDIDEFVSDPLGYRAP
jgi:prophage regulatory protein